MSNTPRERGQCDEMLLQLDQYLDRSLGRESTKALQSHVSECPSCAQELEARRSLRAQLKTAVRSVETPAFLESRIRASLEKRQPPFRWIMSLAAVAAVLVIGLGVAISYERGYFRYNRASQDSYISSVSSSMATLMRVGLGDHIHCAVFRKYPKNPPTMAQFIEKMGPKYSGIIPIVRKEVPSDFRLLLAHQCKYKGRPFVHMVLRSDRRLLSVVLTRKQDGEAFTAAQLAPALSEAGVSIYGASTQRFQLAAFETRDYAVYVISDMPQERNMELMRAMAPQLEAYLDKLEG
jgi:anti-sigma factor (TIGR02949 family)